MAATHSGPEAVLTLLAEIEARAALSDRPLRLEVLRPPYPAVGTGVLRVLRVTERGARTEIVAGYEGYERIERRDRTGPSA